jgi:hypothetical protein
MTEEQITEALISGNEHRLLGAIASMMRGDGGGLPVTTPSGVLAGQWNGVASDFPGLQAPAGYNLIATVTAADNEAVNVTLDGIGIAVLHSASAGDEPTTFTTNVGLALLGLGNSGLAQVTFYFVPISPADGLLASWRAGQLVSDVFQRTWTPSEAPDPLGNYVYTVGQYDPMQCGVNEPFTWAQVISLPNGNLGDTLRLDKASEELVRLEPDGADLIVYVSDINFAYNGYPFDSYILITLVCDGLTATLYANGAIVAGPTGYTALTAAAAPGTFTRYDSSGATFGAFAMWNRALTAAQVAALGTGANPNFPVVTP